jgi:hypothetical protein
MISSFSEKFERKQYIYRHILIKHGSWLLVIAVISPWPNVFMLFTVYVCLLLTLVIFFRLLFLKVYMFLFIYFWYLHGLIMC